MNLIPTCISNLTNKELKELYQQLDTEYNLFQTHLFHYSQYVKEYKKTGKLYSPNELLQKRTQTWEKLNPVILEMRKRNINTKEQSGQKMITDWI